MVALYAFSMLTALVAAFVLSRTVIPSKSVPLILELPPYRVPRLGPTLRMMRTRASQFLSEAGTVILAATIVLWTLLSFPRVPAEALEAGAPATSSVSWSDTAPPLADSYAGMAGKAIEPAMAPLGFDWKITTAIIGAFAAREVFVSTLGLIFGIEDADETALPLRERIRAERAADGSPKYTPLMGLSLMVFFALACQCMSTLAVVRRETRSYKWPLFLFAYMTTLAYVCSFVVYQGGRILGY
jgi:ferrous iron transport protein B